MDMKTFLAGYKNVVIIAVAALAIVGFLLSKIVPSINSISTIKAEYTAAQSTLADKERLLKDLQEKAKAEKENKNDIQKPFFKGIDKGLDTEAVIANEFAEILTLLRSHSIKARSVDYEYDPKDDNFVKGAAASYNVAKLKIEMVGTYKNFEGLLKELFKHEHFLDIDSFEIVPYEKNKRILLINMQLKLYAQKN